MRPPKVKLTINDPEPVEGTVVRDVDGRRWERDDGPYGGNGQANWVCDRVVATWVKLAGNYGPVTVLR